MERFVVLRTVTDQLLANHACAVLEDAGIGVMLEHVTIEDGNAVASGYRILVPWETVDSAKSLVDRVLVSARRKKGVRSSDSRPFI